MIFNRRARIESLIRHILQRESIKGEYIEGVIFDYMVYNGNEDYKLLLDLNMVYGNDNSLLKLLNLKCKTLNCNRTFITIEIPKDIEIFLARKVRLFWKDYGTTWGILATSYTPKNKTHYWEL